MSQLSHVSGKSKQNGLSLVLGGPRTVPVRFQYFSNIPLQWSHLISSNNLFNIPPLLADLPTCH
jgi:hypothetical protein